MDSTTGLCCTIPQTTWLNEQTENYLTKTEGATIVVTDAPLKHFFTDGQDISQNSFKLAYVKQP